MWNWIKDKMLAGFFVGGIYFLAKLFYDLPDESKLNFFKFHWIKEWINFPIPIYIVIIIVIILLIITRIEKSRLKEKLTPNNKTFFNPPTNYYEKYYSDNFGVRKTKWSWSYKWNSIDKAYNIKDLKPCCNDCGSKMEIGTSFYRDTAVCQKCRLEGRNNHVNVYENVEDVEKEIIRKIENNEIKI